MMNIRDLRYLVELSRYKHFGKAAQACHVSQPALSMQIKKLEKYLGVTLLERMNKGVLLTEIGTLIAEKAQVVLSEVDEMRELARMAIDPFGGELTLGIIPTLAPYLLPHIFPTFKQIFPQLKIYLIEAQTMVLMDKLKQGDIDGVILSPFVANPEFKSVGLFAEEFLLAVHPTHVLAKRKKIKQNELQGEALLLLEDGHCLRDQALAICHLISAEEAKGFNATSLETLRHMVAAGVGITLIPKLAMKNNDGVFYVPFSSPKAYRNINLLWRKSSAKDRILNQLALEIKKIVPANF